MAVCKIVRVEWGGKFGSGWSGRGWRRGRGASNRQSDGGLKAKMGGEMAKCRIASLADCG